MMKVLVISSTVLQYISVGKITTELYKKLISTGNESKILYLGYNGDEINDENISCIYTPKGSFINFQLTKRTNFIFDISFVAIKAIRTLLNHFDADIIQLIQPSSQFINNKRLFDYLGSTGIPCIYTMIDENPYLGLCDNAYSCDQFLKNRGCLNCHGENTYINKQEIDGWSQVASRRLAKQKYLGYKKIRDITFTAPEWVIQRASSSYLLHNRNFQVVDEYINNSQIFIPREYENLLEKYSISKDKIIILNVARYTNLRKGVKYFVDLAKKFEDSSKYLFINIGYDGSKDNLPNNFLGISFVQDQVLLSQFYSMADLYIITSFSDTMPNACLEALSCGTPICGFNISGIPYVAPNPLGKYVTSEDINELINVVNETKKKTKEISENCRKYAVERYSEDVFFKKMLEIYEKSSKGRIRK